MWAGSRIWPVWLVQDHYKRWEPATLEGTRQQPSLTITEAERTAEYLLVKPVGCWGKSGAQVSKATPTNNHHKQIWRKEAGQVEGQTKLQVAAFVAAK